MFAPSLLLLSVAAVLVECRPQVIGNTGSTRYEPTTVIPGRDPAYRLVTALPEGCECLFLSHYTPVCGKDGQTYLNRGLLDCINGCRANKVDVHMEAACKNIG